MKIIRAPLDVAVVCTLLCLVAIPVGAQTLKFRGVSLDASPQAFIQKLGAPDKVTHGIGYFDRAFDGKDKPESPKYPNSGNTKMIGDTDYDWNSMGVAGYNAGVELSFWKDRLVGAAYTIHVSQAPNDQEQLRGYVNSYGDLLDKLTKLYGQPKTKSEPIHLGSGGFSALLGSEVINSAPYTSKWDFGNGEIMLGLSLDADTSKDSVGIAYWTKWALDKLKAIMQEGQKAQKENTSGL